MPCSGYAELSTEPSHDKSSDDLGWPRAFFERTADTIPDLERPPQGESISR